MYYFFYSFNTYSFVKLDLLKGFIKFSKIFGVFCSKVENVARIKDLPAQGLSNYNPELRKKSSKINYYPKWPSVK